MLRPNLAYNSTFNCVISSLIVLNFSSRADTLSSILDVDVVSNSCTSGNGRLIKESPILYLPVVSRYIGAEKVEHTESCRPHLQAPVHSKCRPDPLSPSTNPSARALLPTIMTDMFRLQFIFEIQLSLVQPAEFVDLVLVFSPNFDLVAACGGLVFF